jgi:hypothetical protein
MTVQMPDPIPLEMPPGDAQAMADLARDIAAAGRCLAAIDARIADAVDGVPGWLGDDASAAAAQVVRVDTLVRAAYDAVMRAADRLSRHAERLLETRSHVRALQHEQHEEFGDAWRRWGSLPDLQLQVVLPSPEAHAIIDELEARERSRRRRHTALLHQIEDDAAATARVLVDSCAAVGGSGRPDGGRFVVAYLAAQLPGWGDRELIHRGRELAGRLTAGTPEEKARAASTAAAFASSTPFATAFLAALGVEGVAYVLRDLGNNQFERDSSVARTLAAAFGAAVPGAGPGDPVARVLDAEYVHADDDFALAGTVATGLAMVLAAGGSMPSDGVATRTVATWGRQFLRWEHRQRDRIGTRSADWAPEVGDPTGLAISILARRAEPAVSAALLDDPAVVEAALARVYDDGGTALGRVLTQAGTAAGARSDRVARLALATAGAGLAGDDPAAWTVNRQTLAAVAPSLGAVVSAHVDVAVEALKVGVDGQVHGDQADVLAGLGYVTLDRGAATAIQEALSAWAQVRPAALGSVGPPARLSAAATLGAYVAVREFAQRTDHAMNALEDQADARAKQVLWKYTFGLLGFVGGPVGTGLGVGEGYAAIGLDNDGTWVDRPDRGPVFLRADAASLARTALAPEAASDVRGVVRQARAAFDRIAAVLPVRGAPKSPQSDLWAPIVDLGADTFSPRLEDGMKLPEIHPPH